MSDAKAIVAIELLKRRNEWLLLCLKSIGDITENCFRDNAPKIALQAFASPLRSIQRITRSAASSASHWK